MTRWNSFIGTILLALGALVGNAASVNLLFGVDLIFGSVAVVLAAMLLGVVPAVVVAVTGGAYTLLIWGHPYALVIFTAEALVVAGLYRYKKLNPVISDALFWVLVGVPLIYFFYSHVMAMPPEAVSTILFKQPINGLFNALIAGILVLTLQFLSSPNRLMPRQGIKTTEVLFYCFLTLILAAGVTPIIYDAHSHMQEKERRLSQDLAEDNRRLIAHLDDKRLDFHRYWITENKDTLAQAMLIGGNRPLLQSGSLMSFSAGGQLEPIDDNFGVWLPNGQMSQMQRWREGRYVRRDSVEHASDITAVVSELPAAPVIESVQSKYNTLFTLLILMLTAGLLVSMALSRWLTAPIRALTQASGALDQRITGHRTLELPESNITEFQQLSETLGGMSARLKRSLEQLDQSRKAVQRQVDERTRELNDTSRLLRSVLEAATEFAIIATDPSGRIILSNSGAQKLLGYSADELHDNTPAMFLAPEEIPQPIASETTEDGHFFNRIVSRAAKEGLDARELTFSRKDGEQIPVWLTITPTQEDSGGITGFLVIAEDITERKQLDRMKNEFISTVSHELRTPLTSIAGALGLVNQGATGELTEKAHKMIDVAYRNTQHLSHLVNDLLDMEKLVSGKLEMTLIEENLQDTTREALDNIQAFADQKRIELELEGSEEKLFACVDRQRLIQALSNLLSNAIKFSPAGERVYVDFKRDKDGVAIQVHDRGPGIPEHFRHRIFQRFSQNDAADNRNQPGTGLGLAITRNLMSQMGGNAGFESTQGQGSTFWLWVPQQ